MTQGCVVQVCVVGGGGGGVLYLNIRSLSALPTITLESVIFGIRHLYIFLFQTSVTFEVSSNSIEIEIIRCVILFTMQYIEKCGVLF